MKDKFKTLLKKGEAIRHRSWDAACYIKQIGLKIVNEKGEEVTHLKIDEVLSPEWEIVARAKRIYKKSLDAAQETV